MKVLTVEHTHHFTEKSLNEMSTVHHAFIKANNSKSDCVISRIRCSFTSIRLSLHLLIRLIMKEHNHYTPWKTNCIFPITHFKLSCSTLS